MKKILLKEISLVKIVPILLILLPPALISGPAIPDIILTLLAIFFLFFSIKKKLTYFYSNKITLIFIFFCLTLIFSSLLSEYVIYSLTQGESLFFIRFFLFSLLICYFAQLNYEFYLYLAYSFLFCILILVIDGSFQYFTGVNLFGIVAGRSRLTGLFIDEPIIGRYVSTSAMLASSLLFFYSRKMNKNYNLLIIIILFVSLIFTFMTGERVAFGALFGFILVCFILIDRKWLVKILTITFIFFSIYFLISTHERSQDRTLETFHDLNLREFKFMIATPVHDAHYKSAILMFKDHPFFGIGSNLFRKYCDYENYIVEIPKHYNSSSCTTHPHNYYFQILAENGIFGLIIFTLLFLILSFRLLVYFLSILFGKFSYLNKLKEEHIPFYVFMFFMIFPFWPTGNLYANWTNVPIFIGLGFLLVSQINLDHK